MSNATDPRGGSLQVAAQALDRLGEGLTAVAWAEDGTVEAAELDGARFVIGVQGHPEVGEDQRLFRGLVAAAGEG